MNQKVMMAVVGLLLLSIASATCAATVTSPAETTISAGEQKDNVYLWKYVGRNPYGGTLEWALTHSGWPKEVQLTLTKRWNDQKTVVAFASGQDFDWMSEGGLRKGTQIAVHHNVRAQWPLEEREAADSVNYLYQDVLYTLVKVHKCGNFGGIKGQVSTSIPPGPIYGMIPEVVCPPNVNCCS
jgi:hypothetical protein